MLPRTSSALVLRSTFGPALRSTLGIVLALVPALLPLLPAILTLLPVLLPLLPALLALFPAILPIPGPISPLPALAAIPVAPAAAFASTPFAAATAALAGAVSISPTHDSLLCSVTARTTGLDIPGLGSG
jgi:hypothetical protein